LVFTCQHGPPQMGGHVVQFPPVKFRHPVFCHPQFAPDPAAGRGSGERRIEKTEKKYLEDGQCGNCQE